MNAGMESREMTHREWADKLLSKFLSAEELEIVLNTVEQRGAMRERQACRDLAYEHARTISEVTVGDSPLGLTLEWQQQIDVAAEMRHVAQYVGALISMRSPKPPSPLDFAPQEIQESGSKSRAR